MHFYVNRNADVLWDMKERFNIPDDIVALQLLRKERKVRSDASDSVWDVPDDIDLS